MSSMRLGGLPRAHTSSSVRLRKRDCLLSSSNSGGDDVVNPAQQRQLRLRLPQSSIRTDVIGPCPQVTLFACLRAGAFTMASLHGDAFALCTHGNVHIARHSTPGERCNMSIYRRMRSLSSNSVLVVLWRTQEHARHGELPNRIRDCSIPTPPDGTPKAHLNPFANCWHARRH